MGGEGRVVVEVQLQEETTVASECSRKEAAAPATSNECGTRCLQGSRRLGAGCYMPGSPRYWMAALSHARAACKEAKCHASC